jgi:biotin carboxylase
MSSTDRILVLYSHGAVGPIEVAAELSGLGTVVLGVPELDAPSIVPFLQDVCDFVVLCGDTAAMTAQARNLAPAAVVTFAESMLPLAAAVTTELDLPGHSLRTVADLTDKSRQRARLAAAGVDDVACLRLTDLGQWPAVVTAVGLPLVLKPTHGQGSRSTYRVDTFEQGEALVCRMLGADSCEGSLVAESLLVGRSSAPFGDHVSVETVVARGVVSHLAVTGKFPLLAPFREQGQFWPAPLDESEVGSILDLTTAAIDALGVSAGVLHSEVKLTAAGPRLIEVNGRMGGFMNDLGARATGLNLVELAGLVALGEDVKVERVIPDQTYFQYDNLAPTAACRLVAVDGTADVRGVPGVVEYRQLVAPGTELPGGVDTRELDLICGTTSSYAEMFQVLDKALARLTFTFQRGARQDRVSGTELSAWGLGAEHTPATAPSAPGV